MLPSIDLGFIEIPLYGPIFGIGAVIAIIIVSRISERTGVRRYHSLYAAIYGMIGLVIGAKLLYLITKLPAIISRFDAFSELFKLDYKAALDFAFGGMVFYGGLLGFIAGAYLYCRQYKVPFIGLVDLYTPFLPFVHGFGRIGCFCAGCCYGVEYHGVLSVHFPYNEVVPELSDVERFPVQLVEALFNFICFAVLFTLMRKEMKRPEEDRKLRQGQLCGIYLTYYLVVRTVLEFFRGDAIRGKVGFLSTSQIISLLLIVPAVLLLRAKGREKIFFVTQNEEAAGREPLCAENK